MRAIVYETYGPPEVLQIREVAKPVPKANEVLIRTRATTVTSGDWRARSLEMPPGFGLMGRLVFGIAGPRQKILGTEIAGTVEAIAAGVTKFKVGDEVFAFPGAAMGGYAEYKCMPQDAAIAIKPPALSFEQAAALSFGGTTALKFFKRGGLQRGERVLINGASGGVGTAAVQLAKHFGADVTGVCSAANASLVTSIGADRVIDYQSEDFTRNGQRYDVIVDTAGTAPFSRSRGSLTERGRLLVVLGGIGDLVRMPWIRLTSRQQLIAGPSPSDASDLEFLARLAQAGEFTPVIDRRYTFETIVDAHRYLDTGRKRGNIVMSVGE